MERALNDMGEILRDISIWLDKANAHRDPEAATWGRVAKVAEEVGEVIDAMIGMTAQNPRKGLYSDVNHVVEELLDVALTALAAVEHLTGNEAEALPLLAAHTLARAQRVNLR